MRISQLWGRLLAKSSGGFAVTANVKVESLVPGDDAPLDSSLLPLEERPRVVEIWDANKS